MKHLKTYLKQYEQEEQDYNIKYNKNDFVLLDLTDREYDIENKNEVLARITNIFSMRKYYPYEAEIMEQNELIEINVLELEIIRKLTSDEIEQYLISISTAKYNL